MKSVCIKVVALYIKEYFHEMVKLTKSPLKCEEKYNKRRYRNSSREASEPGRRTDCVCVAMFNNSQKTDILLWK